MISQGENNEIDPNYMKIIDWIRKFCEFFQMAIFIEWFKETLQNSLNEIGRSNKLNRLNSQHFE